MDIEHRPDQHRFETTVDGAHGAIVYRKQDGVMTLVHTEVDPSLQGKGVAGALVRAALDHAKTRGLKVDPVCEYAKSYMARHPETMALHVDSSP